MTKHAALTRTTLLLSLSLATASLASIGCGGDADGGISVGSGGTTGGAGGNKGGGGASATGTCGKGTMIADFSDGTTQGFTLDTYADTNEFNLGAPPSTVTLSYDATEGNPTAGSLKIEAPFTDYKQHVGVQKDLGMTNTMDFTGKKLHVCMKVASGFNPDMKLAPGGGQPHVQGFIAGATPGVGDQYPYSGLYANIASNDWSDYTWSFATASYSDTTFLSSTQAVVRLIGMQIGSGNPSPAPAAKPTAAVFYIDSISVE